MCACMLYFGEGVLLRDHLRKLVGKPLRESGLSNVQPVIFFVLVISIC